MAIDALDPGDDFTFPYLPRTPEGYLDTALMPIGERRQPGPNGPVLIDVTPTVLDRDGRLVPVTAIVPPPPPE